ncbi:hypothetical protein VB735_05150 [Halotia wernerae UHCC 0503]|nr:hypothetical protein [Halotia wernerae UHCC 0503]
MDKVELTDFFDRATIRATIYDVIIKPTHRKMGFSDELIDTIINHHQLNTVEQIALYCLP